MPLTWRSMSTGNSCSSNRPWSGMSRSRFCPRHCPTSSLSALGCSPPSRQTAAPARRPRCWRPQRRPRLTSRSWRSPHRRGRRHCAHAGPDRHGHWHGLGWARTSAHRSSAGALPGRYPDSDPQRAPRRVAASPYHSACWPSGHGPARPSRWSQACHPARHEGVSDHSPL